MYEVDWPTLISSDLDTFALPPLHTLTPNPATTTGRLTAPRRLTAPKLRAAHLRGAGELALAVARKENGEEELQILLAEALGDLG